MGLRSEMRNILYKEFYPRPHARRPPARAHAFTQLTAACHLHQVAKLGRHGGSEPRRGTGHCRGLSHNQLGVTMVRAARDSPSEFTALAL